MNPDEILIWYKIFRVAILVIALYGIIYFVYFSRYSKRLEEPAKRMLEEQD